MEEELVTTEELLGVVADPGILEAKILDSLSWMHAGLARRMYPQILARVSSMLENAGGEVLLKSDVGPVPCVVKGVDEKGRLVVELAESRSSALVEDRAQLLKF